MKLTANSVWTRLICDLSWESHARLSGGWSRHTFAAKDRVMYLRMAELAVERIEQPKLRLYGRTVRPSLDPWQLVATWNSGRTLRPSIPSPQLAAVIPWRLYYIMNVCIFPPRYADGLSSQPVTIDLACIASGRSA
ncbi:hypothetical protein [Ralstonia pseudosolanacearum]|uniref:hypothetical protein n=1 Tax=Ralstonia pseudosolanacearum TaxID=1310165 RepID=UPI001267FA50|nr:hypothetical protein [Ralstonia pseudosolanacearum]